MTRVRRFLAAAVLAAAFLAAPGAGPAVAQCAMCKATLTGSAEGRAMGQELNKGILVMLAAPYLVFGSFMAAAFRHRIQRRVSRLARLAFRLGSLRHPPGQPPPP